MNVTEITNLDAFETQGRKIGLEMPILLEQALKLQEASVGGTEMAPRGYVYSLNPLPDTHAIQIMVINS